MLRPPSVVTRLRILTRTYRCPSSLTINAFNADTPCSSDSPSCDVPSSDPSSDPMSNIALGQNTRASPVFRATILENKLSDPYLRLLSSLAAPARWARSVVNHAGDVNR
ncbi:hypothetical protein I7I48_01286 [Histoplasma ohiense]|nr:hypothetical protein I7I48_01286 [Histoplasma ohiense (nom. inval.)]